MSESSSSKPKRRFGCGQVVCLMLVTAILSAGAMFWWAKRYLFAKELAPVALSAEEQSVLEGKLERLEQAAMGNEPKASIEGQVLETADQDPNAEAYSEEGASREIELSERELNALIAKNDPDTAKHFAVDLSKDMVSMKVIVPVDEEAPFMGGKTIRIKAGLGV
ncbi:MAG: arginine N-succinyltransferase, partial [Verrucomicrobiales bacterium]